MDSVNATETAASAVATSQKTRVSLADIEANIACESMFIVGEACSHLALPAHPSLDLLTVCVLTLQNGFTVVGKTAPADPVNFNADLGRKFAREDAIRQIWPLMGYAMREKLSNG